jgi:hypothetical protein
MKPQLTKLVDAPPEGPEWLHEIKFDGYRMHARLDRGAVRLLTRTASTGRKVPRPRIGDIVTSGKAGLSRRRIPARLNHFLQPDPERIRHREWRGACLFPVRPSPSRWRCPQPEAGQERKERLRALLPGATPPLQYSDHQIGRDRAFKSRVMTCRLRPLTFFAASPVNLTPVAATAGIRLIVWCRDCRRQIEPEGVAENRHSGGDPRCQLCFSGLELLGHLFEFVLPEIVARAAEPIVTDSRGPRVQIRPPPTASHVRT